MRTSNAPRLPFVTLKSLCHALLFCGMLQDRVLAAVPVDMTRYSPECGVVVEKADERLTVTWPIAEGEFGRVVFRLREGQPANAALIERIGIAPGEKQPDAALLTDVDPLVCVTIGSRVTPPGKPAPMASGVSTRRATRIASNTQALPRVPCNASSIVA